MKGAAKVAFGDDSLAGKIVAVQGLGKVGWRLCEYLHKEGARLYVSNLHNKETLAKAVEEFGAVAVPADQILAQECDILAPCAMGAVVNPDTIPKFNCKIVAGAANNVILDEASGLALKARGIWYAPDFIINAGGVINAAAEAAGAYDEKPVLEKVNNIYNTVEKILLQSKENGRPEGELATEYAESLIH